MADNKDKKIGVDMSSEKKKALDVALGQIEKQFGKGSIMKLGEKNKFKGKAFDTRIT